MAVAKEVKCIKHPEYPKEKVHLQNTIQIVHSLIEALHFDLNPNTAKQYDHDYWGYDRNAEIIESYLHKSKEDDLYDLESVLDDPYFARVDFRADGHVSPETYYIGRTGIHEFRSGFNPGQSYIIDWRTPLAAGIFYQSQNGRAIVDAPGESYSGEILLKRQYEIESGELYDFADDDTMDQYLGDKFLITKLLKGANQRLKDIVSTIQREQDEIIRRPLNELTLVQGVAGSGKTTVGLHRIAYLIYTYKIMPSEVAVIAPNRLFLNYISDVLPGLHADGVWQGTFEDLAEKIIGFSVKPSRCNLIEELIKEHGWQENDGRIKWIRLRGSLEYKEMLDKFTDTWRECLAANVKDIYESITIDKNNIKLNISGSSISNRLRDAKTPINKIIQGINTYIRKQLTDQVRQQLDLYEVKEVRTREGGRVSKRKELIELPIPQIYQQSLNQYIHRYTLATVGSADFYNRFLQSEEIVRLRKSYGLGHVAESELSDKEDLAALCYLHLKLEGANEYAFEHIMVDEAQDRSAFELIILSLLSKRESLTLLGDINQAIYSYRSFGTWDELRSHFTRSPISFYTMRMSYRSAAEVVEWCNRLIRNPSARGIPVYQVEKKPKVTNITTNREAIASITSIIREWRQEGMRSIGIIVKQLDGCIFLYEELRKSLPEEDIKVILTEMNEFSIGVSIVPVILAKGLEFDGVIVANASDEHYQKTDLDRNLLYVALSRALYRLHIVYAGRMSLYLKNDE